MVYFGIYGHALYDVIVVVLCVHCIVLYNVSRVCHALKCSMNEHDYLVHMLSINCDELNTTGMKSPMAW